MSEVVTIGGQSVLNVQVQGAGTLESLFETLRANDITFEDPTPGTKIQVVAERPSLELAMQKSGVRPASLDKEEILKPINDYLILKSAKDAISESGGTLLSESCLKKILID